jgi:hypothetical protein
MLRIVLWHLLGWLLIGFGVNFVLGDLMADHGFWPSGIALVAFGVWAWTRGIQARPEQRKAS